MLGRMEDRRETSPPPRYRWPWFLLAALILAVVLAVVWMSVAVKRLRAQRDFSQSSVVQTATKDLLAGFRDVLQGGDAEAGRKIFVDRPEANCAKCHKVGGQGSDTGPALDGIGTRRSREFILEAILYPNLHVSTNYETVILFLNNGSGLSGMLGRETETNLVVKTGDEGPVTVSKADIKIRQKGMSPMPEGLGTLLPKKDLQDLMEYVGSLK